MQQCAAPVSHPDRFAARVSEFLLDRHCVVSGAVLWCAPLAGNTVLPRRCELVHVLCSVTAHVRKWSCAPETLSADEEAPSRPSSRAAAMIRASHGGKQHAPALPVHRALIAAIVRGCRLWWKALCAAARRQAASCRPIRRRSGTGSTRPLWPAPRSCRLRRRWWRSSLTLPRGAFAWSTRLSAFSTHRVIQDPALR